jgi:hypothetical protein
LEIRAESRTRRFAVLRREFYIYSAATLAFAVIVLLLSAERT